MTKDERDSLDNSTIGEGHLAEPPPTTTSIRSIHSAGDPFTHPADIWLQSAEFYHGYLPREDIPPILLKNGDFLVRLSEANVKGSSKRKRTKTSSRVISVLIDPQSKNELIPLEKRAELIKNIVIMHKSKKWWIDPAIQFESLASLFEHYQSKPLLVEKDTILLKRGVGLCRWEFKHANVQVGRLLGKGAYGEVRKGTVIRKNGQIVNVAVKTLTMTNLLTRELIREIMKEARIMRDLHHVNVVAMIGVVLIDHPLYILLEYVSGGALDVYLKRKHTKITREERIAMMIGIASGMDYIHKANIIHRDLAARNCLYDRSHTVKISDFGLSRNGSVYKMKSAQKMPIKWMAPESILTFTFTQKTDVYTFGVLTYEIFAAVGPYDDLRNSVVKKMIVEGKVNQFPDSAPEYVVNFVKEKLWCKDPDKRPDFSSIVADLETLATTHGDKTDVADDHASQAISEGKTTATIEIDVAAKPKGQSKKPDTGKSPESKTKDVQNIEPKKAKEVVAALSKESAKKSEKEVPSSCSSKGVSPAMKSPKEPVKKEAGQAELTITQIDIDSRREKDDFKDVEIRTKPVFGRRSKFKRSKRNS